MLSIIISVVSGIVVALGYMIIHSKCKSLVWSIYKLSLQGVLFVASILCTLLTGNVLLLLLSFSFLLAFMGDYALEGLSPIRRYNLEIGIISFGVSYISILVLTILSLTTFSWYAILFLIIPIIVLLTFYFSKSTTIPQLMLITGYSLILSALMGISFCISVWLGIAAVLLTLSDVFLGYGIFIAKKNNDTLVISTYSAGQLSFLLLFVLL